MSIISELLAGCFLTEIDFKYSILKVNPDFPNLPVGSDLDMFVEDLQRAQEHIVATISQVLPSHYNIDIRGSSDQAYVDVLDGDRLIFRFDLWQKFPNFSKVRVKESFFFDVIYTSQMQNMNGLSVFVPNPINNLILRYIEFIEWFDERPDKIKHANYISQLIDNETHLSDDFFSKLNRIIQLPLFEEANVSPKKEEYENRVQYLFKKIRRGTKFLKRNGIIATVKKIKKEPRL
jgi:hypothetical protein